MSQQRSGFTPPPGSGAGGGGARAAAPPLRAAPPLGAKRPVAPDPRAPLPHKPLYDAYQAVQAKRKKRLADKILPQKVRDLVPESQAYMDLLAFERKLDATILRKRLDIQEALKRPMKQKRKLRIFISNTFYPGAHGDPFAGRPSSAHGTNDSHSFSGQGDNGVASWELRVEGRLLDDSKNDPNKVRGSAAVTRRHDTVGRFGVSIARSSCCR